MLLLRPAAAHTLDIAQQPALPTTRATIQRWPALEAEASWCTKTRRLRDSAAATLAHCAEAITHRTAWATAS
jgi:hypothetical protein